MISASDHFAIWCWVMVFPVPNPPGMAAVPPFAIGNIVSRIRCPVISGTDAGYLFRVGRGTRIGHFCASVISFSVPSSSFSFTIGSRMVYFPSLAAQITVPLTSGGTIDLCTMERVSCVSAMIAPPISSSPSETVTWTSHFLSVSRESTVRPRLMYLPDCFAISDSGRSIPSKMLFRIPGPSVTERASPDAVTVSPGFSPVVSSKTCTVVVSFVRAITSPTRRSLPT